MNHLSYLERLAQFGVNSAHPGGISLTRDLLTRESFSPTTVFLDVGCGTGQTAAWVGIRYPCKITAVDLDPQMVKQASHKFSRLNLDIQLLRADAEKLPFPDCCFDVVLSESVTVFTQISKALKEYFRVLKPGGIFLAIEATALQPLMEDATAEISRVLGLTILPTGEEWSQHMQSAGFSQVQVLCQQPLTSSKFCSPFAYYIFNDYINMVRRYHGKFGYGVYRCRK